jgi:hypothetical protein
MMEKPMSRFYFDFHEGHLVRRDPEGIEFESLEAAEWAAVEAAAEIEPSDLPKGKVRKVKVEVRDEHGQQVFTVAVAMTIRRTKPAHA